tara:strand:+ start:354 stop:1343 length:990 start_codon:yes stop_codon:yes gene_type:complete
MSKAAELAALIGSGQAQGNQNTIINGAMNVAQRGTSSTGLGAASGYFTCDKWKMDFGNTAGRLTMTQAADGPSGFANCIKLDCTTADASIGAEEYGILAQRLEGQDLQKFMKGTSDAKSYTVSFYVKGNASATYILELIDRDNSRSVSKAFSVTTDWSRVELTFPADTTGAFGDDNAASLDLQWWFHSGSTYNSGTLQQTWAGTTAANRAVGGDSFFDSTNRTFFITGVQLEIGDVATPFEHRSYGDELARCQRYYSQSTGQNIHGKQYNNSTWLGDPQYPVTMRATPTVTTTGGQYSSIQVGTSKDKFYFQRTSESCYISDWKADAEL